MTEDTVVVPVVDPTITPVDIVDPAPIPVLTDTVSVDPIVPVVVSPDPAPTVIGDSPLQGIIQDVEQVELTAREKIVSWYEDMKDSTHWPNFVNVHPVKWIEMELDKLIARFEK
jgi:hypothetical protein